MLPNSFLNLPKVLFLKICFSDELLLTMLSIIRERYVNMSTAKKKLRLVLLRTIAKTVSYYYFHLFLLSNPTETFIRSKLNLNYPQ